jgi:hypothetical protein
MRRRRSHRLDVMTAAVLVRVRKPPEAPRDPKCGDCVQLANLIDRRRRQLGAVMDLTPAGDHGYWWDRLEDVLHSLDHHRADQHPRRVTPAQLRAHLARKAHR